MPGDGKNLETLVALIEKLHLPEGFKLSTNDRVYDDRGNQIAEFDVVVEGRLGTVDLKWLIECRDRPSEGPAPCSRIEQLIGRKQRFKEFNKVTAVSTTGFAPGVAKSAEDGGIELREVHSLTAKEVEGWLLMETMPSIERSFRLLHATLGAADKEPEPRRRLFDQIVTSKQGEPILWQTENQERYTIKQAFQGVLRDKEDLFDAIERDGPPYPLTIQVLYPNDASHFVVKTDLGDVRVLRIDFQAELSLTTKNVALAHLSDYVRSCSGESIAQSAAFEFTALGAQLSLEMHKLGDSGETHIVLRKLGPASGA